jgi:hypothetical protein
MWNWNPLLLQPSPSILNSTSHPGILLAMGETRNGRHGAHDQQILRKLSHCRHNVSMFCDIGEAGGSESILTTKLRKREGNSVQEMSAERKRFLE